MTTAALPRLNPATTALLVVDMQNDFCHREGFYERSGRPSAPLATAIEPIRLLLSTARDVGAHRLFTRIVYADDLDLTAGHVVKPPGWAGQGQRLRPGSWGADIVDDLRPLDDELVIDKPSYSAFFRTQLEEELRRRCVTTVLLTGTVAYACVLHTAFDAFVRGFDVVLVEDAVSSWFEDLAVASNRITELLLGRTINSESASAALRG